MNLKKFGVIGLVLAIGLALVGCGSKCPGGGDCHFSRTASGVLSSKNICTDSGCYVYKAFNTNKLSSSACDCK